MHHVCKTLFYEHTLEGMNVSCLEALNVYSKELMYHVPRKLVWEYVFGLSLADFFLLS